MACRRTPVAAVLTLALLAGGALAASPAPAVTPESTAERPNIVVILADDLDQTTTPYWDVLTHTKALLADRGMTFTGHFAPTPICCPARATLLTGKYGHNTGVRTNGGDQGGWETFAKNGNEERTIAKRLNDAGYRTGMVGKYLNGYDEQSPIPPGYDDWRVAVDDRFYLGYGYTLNENGTLVEYGNDPQDYATDVVAEKSVGFIEDSESADAEPFMLYVSPTAPHLGLPPAPRHADHPYREATTPRRPNFQEPDLSDKPRWLRSSGDERARMVEAINDEDYQNRMGSLYAFDELVASVVSALERTGELDNTYVVFASDNGYNLGAHRLLHKMAPYEESVRVPFVVTGPDVAPRSTQSRMTLHTDLAPTLLELAGVDVPTDMDGTSLAGLLRGTPPATWRSDFVAEYVSTGLVDGIGSELPGNLLVRAGIEIPSYRAVRTSRWLYVEWAERDQPVQPDDRELYDLTADPYQLDNALATAAGRQAHAAVVAELQERLADLSGCSGATCRR